MSVKVTQDHIDRGHRGNPFKCPIGLACSDATGFEFGADYKHLWDHTHDIRYSTPPEIEEFQDRFDHSQEVLPCEFELGEPIAPNQPEGS